MMITKDPEKFFYIDALRGIAILAVLVCHCGQQGQRGEIALLHGITHLGKYGVQLFFMVSALTLFMSMNERSAYESHSIRNYFIRRFFRIAPLFYIAIIYYLIEDGFGPRSWLGNAQGISFANILASVTFINGINPYWFNSLVPGGWTVAVEMMFYLTLPLIYKKVKKLRTALIFLVVFVACSQLFIIILQKMTVISDAKLWKWYLDLCFISQAPLFLLGIVLYYLIKLEPKILWNKLKQNVYLKKLSFVGIALLVIVLTFKSQMRINLIVAGIFSVGIYFLSVKPIKLVVNSFTIFMGKISFSIYLIHPAVVYYMKKFNFIDFNENLIINYGIRYMVLLVGTVCISFLTYTWIEKPGRALGKEIIRSINP